MIHRKFRRILQVETLESRTVLSAAVALTTSNQLLFFDTDTPGSVSGPTAITGLAQGEQVLGIDYRPANGVLYGITRSRLVTINTMSGAAATVGTPFTATLNGTKFGMDFNPAVDRIRLVADSNQDLRFHPDTGQLVAVDGDEEYSHADPLAGQDPTAVAAAYIDNFAGTTTTLLFIIDSGFSTLALQLPPNNGTLNTVTFLGIPTTNLVGFDIETTPSENIGHATFTDAGGATQLYRLHLYGDAPTFVGTLGTSAAILDISLRLGGSAAPGGGDDVQLPGDVIVGLMLGDEAPAVLQQAPVTLSSLGNTSGQDLFLTPNTAEEVVLTPSTVSQTDLDNLFADGFTLGEGL